MAQKYTKSEKIPSVRQKFAIIPLLISSDQKKILSLQPVFLKRTPLNYSQIKTIFMKKLFLSVAICALAVFGLNAQNERFVDSVPTNKNVVLEEYTGIGCQYCPDGHRRANELASANPGRVFIINVHVGYYANNTYTTEFGDSLISQTGYSGFPAGTVNRRIFSDLCDQGESTHTTTDLNRGHWTTAARRVMAETSPVNIAARGTFDWSTRELSITVQLYYTTDEANSTNKLNLAITQDNVLGQQASGITWNPTQMVGSKYRHMHMLRHLITGQWGDDITTTTAGSFVEKTYNYTIPESLGSPNAIAAVLEDLHFVAFVAQGKQEILTGCKVEIENTNMPTVNPHLLGLNNVPVYDYSTDAKVNALVTNGGSDTITAISFQYTVANGTPQTYDWTGEITYQDSKTIEFPTLTVNTNTNQVVKAKIISINGQPFEGSEVSLTIKKSVAEGTSIMTLKIKTDGYARETSYKLYGPNNQIVQQSNSFTNNTEHEFPINLTQIGCYRLSVLDSYGDGISGGYIRVFDINNNQIVNISGSTFSAEAVAMISVGTIDINDRTMDENTIVFPNPATENININSESSIQMVEIYNLQGQRVLVENGNVSTLSVSGLANGMYLLKVTTEKGVSTYKISKQ